MYQPSESVISRKRKDDERLNVNQLTKEKKMASEWAGVGQNK